MQDDIVGEDTSVGEKAWICNLYKSEGSSRTSSGVFFWYGPLAKPLTPNSEHGFESR